MSRDDLVPPIGPHHVAILRRIHDGGVAPIVHASGLADIPFLDIEALCRAGLLERLTMGRFKGYRLTDAGKTLLMNPLE
jgi:predicted transcriptional regulator